MGLTLGNLGVTYGDLGDLPRALDHFRQAIEIGDEFSDRRINPSSWKASA